MGWASTGRRRTFFLGGGHPTQLERDKALVGTAPLAGAGALVLASDGLSERGIGVEDPPATVTQALGHASGSEPDRRALEACRGVAETAMEAQRRNSSGDNLAVAVLWLAS